MWKLLIAAALLLPASAGPACAADEAVAFIGDVAYGPLPRQKLDIYAPAAGAADAPILVFFYGGTWQQGSKSYLRALGESFAESGIVFVAPDYRLYPEAVFPQFVEDCALAVAHVWRTMRDADGGPRPIIVAGHSAGAYNAGMVALDQGYLAADGVPPGAVKGFVGVAGAYARFVFGHLGLEQIFPEPARERSGIVDFVDAADPPMLLIAGDADRVVSLRHVEALREAATTAGLDVSVDIRRGFDHMGVYYALIDRGSAIRDAVDAFIRRVAGGA